MGKVAYQGPSRIDGKPVVLLVSSENGSSVNEKTGPMAQTWILRADIAPHVAIHTGDDESVCGNCEARGRIVENEDGTTRNTGRFCYVNVRNAPRAVWMAWKNGKYKDLAKNTWSDLTTRLGSYGDPAAVPFRVLKDLVKRGCGKWTGYTHQWKEKKFQPLRKLVMASTATVEETQAAWAMGWRTFRIRKAGEPLLKGEFECPASKEQGFRLNCDTCLACNGIGLDGTRKNAVSVSIVVHGTVQTLCNFKKVHQEPFEV